MDEQLYQRWSLMLLIKSLLGNQIRLHQIGLLMQGKLASDLNITPSGLRVLLAGMPKAEQL